MIQLTHSRLVACMSAVLFLLLVAFSSPVASAPVAPRPTRLSLISLFEPAQHPSHDFLTSIQAQANVLDLHILQLVQHSEECEAADSLLPHNVRRRCLTRSAMAESIREMLCGEWKCDEDEEKRVQARVAAIAASTGSFEVFQPLFGLLLQDSLPQGSHWGWLQANTRVGDLESLFPFDLLKRFDIVTYLTNSQEAIHLSKAMTVLRYLPFADLVAGAEEFASSSAFLALRSAGTLSSGFWAERLLHSPRSGLDWIAVTHGLAQTSEAKAISLHGRRLVSIAPQYAAVDVLRKPTSYATFTKSAEISPLRLQRVEEGEIGCTSSDGVDSRLCPMPSSYSNQYRIYYMRVLGQLIERKEPLMMEDQFKKPEEVLFAPSYAGTSRRVQTESHPGLLLQT